MLIMNEENTTAKKMEEAVISVRLLFLQIFRQASLNNMPV